MTQESIDLVRQLLARVQISVLDPSAATELNKFQRLLIELERMEKELSNG